MQREIKFRAFDKEAKTMHKVSQIDFDYQFALLETSDGDYFQKHFRQIELMQFTGLHDKHGKEIYEGDIVKPISLNIIFKVIEWKGAFKLLVNELDNKDDLRPAHRMLDSKEFELIGNIHKNPELLKQNTKDMKINGKNIDEFIEMITQEQNVSFWGDKYTFTPVMCPKIIGDGQQIIYFGTIDQRPFWWYVRIDSKTDIESEDFDIEEVVNLLEGVYGRCDYLLTKKQFEEIKRKGEDFCYEEYRQVDLYENVMSSKNYKYWFNNFVEYPRVHYSGGHWGFVVNFKTSEISDNYNY